MKSIQIILLIYLILLITVGIYILLLHKKKNEKNRRKNSFSPNISNDLPINLGNPLERFFIPSYGNRARLETIGKYFSMVEGYIAKPSQPFEGFKDIVPLTEFVRPDCLKVAYLILNTSGEPNQQGFASIKNINRWEDAFLHSADPALFNVYKLNGFITIFWRADYRNISRCTTDSVKCLTGCNPDDSLDISGYNLYKYNPTNPNNPILVGFVNEDESPFYEFTDTSGTDPNSDNLICYYLRTVTNDHKEYYFSNPICVVPKNLLAPAIISASLIGIPEPSSDCSTSVVNSYQVDFYTIIQSDYSLNFRNKWAYGCECKPPCTFDSLDCCYYSKSYKNFSVTPFSKNGINYFHYTLTVSRKDLAELKLECNSSIGHIYPYCPSQQNPIIDITISTQPSYSYPSGFAKITGALNNRIRDRLWFGLLINLNHPIVAEKTKEFLLEASKYGYNGVFLDMLQPYIVSLHNTSGADAESIEYPDQPGFQDTSDLSKNLWSQSIINLTNSLQEWKKTNLPGFNLIGNSLPIANPKFSGCYHQAAASNGLIVKICEGLDGALSEAIFSEAQLTEPYWDITISILDSVCSQGKTVYLLYPGVNMQLLLTDPTKASYRLAIVISSLMVNKGTGKVMVSYVATDMTLGPWADLQPEFYLPLGDATSDRIWVPSDTIFAKTYHKGVIFFNANSQIKSISKNSVDYFKIRGRKNWIIGNIGQGEMEEKIGELVSGEITYNSQGGIDLPASSGAVFI